MPHVLRTKSLGVAPAQLGVIYQRVKDWWQATGVNFVAHAVCLNTGVTTVTLLAPSSSATGLGASPANHPDQVYWNVHNTVALPAGLQRVEVDDSITPCPPSTTSPHACCQRLAKLVYDYFGGQDVNVEVYTHNDPVNVTPYFSNKTNKRRYAFNTANMRQNGPAGGGYAGNCDAVYAAYDT
jgi:hypothetical protein